MKKSIIILILLSIMQHFSIAQPEDVKVVIRQSLLNKLLHAVGEVKGGGTYTILLIKGKYSWNVNEASVRLEPGKAAFEAKVHVKANPLSYTDDIHGVFDVQYNPISNKMEMKLQHCYFDIYTQILKKRIKIATVDLASFYKEALEFYGPMSYSSQFEFEMPDKSIKRLKAHVQRCDIQVLEGKIEMLAKIEFLEAPDTE
jgi:hypothetical protein